MTGGRAEPELVIEEVTDIDAAWAELRELFLALHKYHEPWLTRRLRTGWERTWREFIALGPNRLVLLARQDGRAVAYLNAQIRNDYGLFDEIAGFIDDTYVAEEHRGTGIGTALLSRCEDWCKKRGATEVGLNVVAANQLGVDIWTRSGFTARTLRMSKTLETTS